jgi:hypothetical protein
VTAFQRGVASRITLGVAREKTMFSVASSARVPATLGAPRAGLRASARRGASVKARAFGSWKKAKPEPKAPKVDENGDPVEEDGIDFTGLKQLISMGLGTISGDITEINLDDPTRTVVMELEANQFEDADGNPLALKAIDNEGFVGDKDEATPVANYLVPIVLGVGSIAGVIATMNAL